MPVVEKKSPKKTENDLFIESGGTKIDVLSKVNSLIEKHNSPDYSPQQLSTYWGEISFYLSKLKTKYPKDKKLSAAIDNWTSQLSEATKLISQDPSNSVNIAGVTVKNMASTLKAFKETGVVSSSENTVLEHLTAATQVAKKDEKYIDRFNQMASDAMGAAQSLVDELERIVEFNDPSNIVNNTENLIETMGGIWNTYTDDYERFIQEIGQDKTYTGSLPGREKFDMVFCSFVKRELEGSSLYSKEVLDKMFKEVDSDGGKTLTFNESGARVFFKQTAAAVVSVHLSNKIFKRYLYGRQIIGNAADPSLDEYHLLANYQGADKDVKGMFGIDDSIRNSILGFESPEGVAKTDDAVAFKSVVTNYVDWLRNNQAAAGFALKALYGQNGEVLRGYAKTLDPKQNEKAAGLINTLNNPDPDIVTLYTEIMSYMQWREVNMGSMSERWDMFAGEKPESAAFLLTEQGDKLKSKVTMTESHQDIPVDSFDPLCIEACVKWGIGEREGDKLIGGSDVDDADLRIVLGQMDMLLPEHSKSIVFQNSGSLDHVLYNVTDAREFSPLVNTMFTQMLALYQTADFSRRFELMGKFWEQAEGKMKTGYTLLDEVGKLAMEPGEDRLKEKGVESPMGGEINARSFMQPLKEGGETYPNLSLYGGGEVMLGLDFSNPSNFSDNIRRLHQKRDMMKFKGPQAGRVSERPWGGLAADKAKSQIIALYNDMMKDERDMKKANPRITSQKLALQWQKKHEIAAQDLGRAQYGASTDQRGNVNAAYFRNLNTTFYHDLADQQPHYKQGSETLDVSAARMRYNGIMLQRFLLKGKNPFMKSSAEYDKQGDIVLEKEDKKITSMLNATMLPSNVHMFFNGYLETKGTKDYKRFANMGGLFDECLSTTSTGVSLDGVRTTLGLIANQVTYSDDTFKGEELNQLWSYINGLPEYADAPITRDQSDELLAFVRGEIEAAGGIIVTDSGGDLTFGTSFSGCEITLGDMNAKLDEIAGEGEPGETIAGTTITTQEDLEKLVGLINDSQLHGSEKERLIGYIRNHFGDGELTKAEYFAGIKELRENIILEGIDRIGGDLWIHTGKAWGRVKVDKRKFTRAEKKAFDDLKKLYSNIASRSTEGPSDTISGVAEFGILLQTLDRDFSGRITDGDRDAIRQQIEAIATEANGYTITKGEYDGIIEEYERDVELGSEWNHLFIQLYQEALPITTNIGLETESEKAAGEESIPGTQEYDKVGFFFGWQTKITKNLEAANYVVSDKNGDKAMTVGLQLGDTKGGEWEPKSVVVAGVYRHEPTAAEEIAGKGPESTFLARFTALGKISATIYGKLEGETDVFGAEVKTRSMKNSFVYRFDPDSSKYEYRDELRFSMGRANFQGFYDVMGQAVDLGEGETVEEKTEKYSGITTYNLGKGKYLDLAFSLGKESAPDLKGENEFSNQAIQIGNRVAALDSTSLGKSYGERQEKFLGLTSQIWDLSDSIRKWNPRFGGRGVTNFYAGLRDRKGYSGGFGMFEDAEGKSVKSFVFNGPLADGVSFTGIFDGTDKRATLQYLKGHTSASAWAFNSTVGVSGKGRFGQKFPLLKGFTVGADVAFDKTKNLKVIEVMAQHPEGKYTVWFDKIDMEKLDAYAVGAKANFGGKQGIGFNPLWFLGQNMSMLAQLKGAELQGISIKEYKWSIEMPHKAWSLNIDGNLYKATGSDASFGKEASSSNYQINASIRWWLR
ncbi:MAG: hypothetical protein ABIG39_04400 [Candidatus Micrarchaeota archaeon]